jgi:hypothetical protein
VARLFTVVPPPVIPPLPYRQSRDQQETISDYVLPRLLGSPSEMKSTRSVKGLTAGLGRGGLYVRHHIVDISLLTRTTRVTSGMCALPAYQNQRQSGTALAGGMSTGYCVHSRNLDCREVMAQGSCEDLPSSKAPLVYRENG